MRHDDLTRQKIQATQLIHRLQNFALGDKPDAMSPAQVTAAFKLLNKILPDLQAIAHTGEDGAPLTIKVTLGGDA